MSIAQTLQGRRFFVTGGTGFLGTAFIERILRTIPESSVVLLIRPGRRTTPMTKFPSFLTRAKDDTAPGMSH